MSKLMLKVRNGIFEDKETNRKIEYQEVYSPICLNGKTYDLVCKFSSKDLKNMVINNLDQCELILKSVEYKGKNYLNPFIKLNLANQPYDIAIQLKEKAEIYLLDVCLNSK